MGSWVSAIGVRGASVTSVRSGFEAVWKITFITAFTIYLLEPTATIDNEITR